MKPPGSSQVFNIRVDRTSYEDATGRILEWAKRGESHYVCCANVHMVMEAHDDRCVLEAVNGASIITPDGMPLVWWLRKQGYAQERVYGPELMLRVCAAAERAKVPIGLHGGAPETLACLLKSLRDTFPGLQVVHAEAPPFRSPTHIELEEECSRISGSGARILFVGLGCPKQEVWMARRRDRLPCVQIGVGAAFDFIAGVKRQAPLPLQQGGLEWAFRLATEPRRLFRRYAVHNTRFLALVARRCLTPRRGHTR
jgi:N-acetylglucosaminyldiphosphoundecaprenol N-acetyl-beta-D-mannosaminyltransferase